MKYILTSKEHKISERICVYTYGIGVTDEAKRLLVSYDDISTDDGLIADFAELLNRRLEHLPLEENAFLTRLKLM